MLNSTWWKDTLERTLATFAEAAIGVWILAGPADVFNVTVLEGTASAGVIAGLAVVKAAIAAHVGHQGASLAPDLATVELPPPPAPVPPAVS